MSAQPEEQSPEATLERSSGGLRGEPARRALVGQAAEALVERYPLDMTQALEFLEEKAREGGRDVADVAHEIVGQRHPPDA